MTLAVVKDCGDIWNRLFDHRPFLSGEIKYFIEEFEEARGDREVKRLADISECLNDLKVHQITKAVNGVSELNKVNTLLDIALQTTDTILEEEDNFDLDKLLAENRAVRKAEWEKFKDELSEKYAEIDRKFDENEKEVIQFYEKLDKHLKP